MLASSDKAKEEKHSGVKVCNKKNYSDIMLQLPSPFILLESMHNRMQQLKTLMTIKPLKSKMNLKSQN